MKKILILCAISGLIFASCNKEQNEVNKNNKSELTSGMMTGTNQAVIPEEQNGILAFEDLGHLARFVEYAEANNDFLDIYNTIGFENNNLEEVAGLTDANNQHATTLSVVNKEHVLLVGENYFKVDIVNGTIITGRKDMFTDWQNFAASPFDESKMNQFAIYEERDEDYNFEVVLTATPSGIVENPKAELEWKFWGKEKGCHEVRVITMYVNDIEYKKCTQTCWEKQYVLGSVVSSDISINDVACP